jgi:hypothetical protein
MMFWQKCSYQSHLNEKNRVMVSSPESLPLRTEAHKAIFTSMFGPRANFYSLWCP